MTMSGQHYPQRGAHSAFESHVRTCPESPSPYSMSTTPGFSTKNTSSYTNSPLDSRHSSINVNALLISPTDHTNEMNRSTNLTGYENDVQSIEGAQKRTRPEKTEHEQLKIDSKNQNEQMKRGGLAVQMRLQEELLDACGVSWGATQAAPNAKSSKLAHPKTDVFQRLYAISIGLIQESMDNAIAKGDPELHFTKMNTFVERGQEKLAKGLHPTHGTFLEDRNATLCQSEKDDLTCTTHSEPDVRACKKRRNKRLVEDHIKQRQTQLQNGCFNKGFRG